ncbi:tRNA-dihydrouridine synthase 3 [Naganishia albida]|nr:tRNA-dihydrouridine synthase 3 [Naganishia albida]
MMDTLVLPIAPLRPSTGVAPVKAEYIVSSRIPTPVVDDDAAECKTNHVSTGPSEDVKDRRDDDAEGGNKRQKVDDRDSGKKLSKEEKKARTGQNKGRRFMSIQDGVRVCKDFIQDGECAFGTKCKMSHDITEYLLSKERDIYFPAHETLLGSPPFVPLPTREERQQPTAEDPSPLFDGATTCPVFEALGYCTFGWRCRFLGAHVAREDGTKPGLVAVPQMPEVAGWRVVEDPEKKARVAAEGKEGSMNHLSAEEIKALQRKRFPYPMSAEYLHSIDSSYQYDRAYKPYQPPPPKKGAKPAAAAAAMNEEEAMAAMDEEEQAATVGLATMTGHEAERDDVPLRPVEKKRLDWRGKTYLAPLTTVGNLPFRQLCVNYGADITCGEMVLSQSLVSGSREEWALTKRHRSEQCFGVQLCGGKPTMMVPAAEALRTVMTKDASRGIDFVDINLGCPIDLIFQRGAGSALFNRPNQLEKILVGMNKVLGDIPLTVKFRMGIAKDELIAHKFIPRFAFDWGVSAMTLHGRTRQQRYSKLANWAYIKECVETLHASAEEKGLPAPPMFGNGDCFSAQQYYEEMEASGVDGIMVARGALIKPWIFTEIKERREWDISATERLEGIRKYAEFALNHYGADTRGVNTARRFLCEALSFQHRYVPIGLLERMPPMMNERPPLYRGRNELETLLASTDSRDWVKISEMFLGKSPEDFNFIPKHKSNAYGGGRDEGEDNQG